MLRAVSFFGAVGLFLGFLSYIAWQQNIIERIEEKGVKAARIVTALSEQGQETGPLVHELNCIPAVVEEDGALAAEQVLDKLLVRLETAPPAGIEADKKPAARAQC